MNRDKRLDGGEREGEGGREGGSSPHLAFPDVDREVDELGILLHQTSQFLWL